VIYRVVAYDRASEAMKGSLVVPPSVLAKVKKIAGFQPQDDGLGEYPLDEAQTRQVLANLQQVLAGCGLGLAHVLAVRIFLTHFEDDYEPMNRVYAEHFPPQRRPARTCVGVTALARGARIEIDLIARRP